MECLKETAAETLIPDADVGVGGGARRGSVVVDLPLGEAAAATFDLEKAVCSHGLFMMAPNQWDPLSKTLLRPLRLDSDSESDNGASLLHSSSPTSLIVRISHPSDSPHSLRLRVFDTDSLSPQHQQNLLDQVRRMLRLSDAEEASVKEFQKMHGESKDRGFGRVFRSPTLFEDMVKCILLCNCQWSRTLSMARSLCELQTQLQSPSFSAPVSKVMNGSSSRTPTAQTDYFVPKTPAGKESNRKRGAKKGSKNLASRFRTTKARIETEDEVIMDSVEMSNGEVDCHESCNSYQTSSEIRIADLIEVHKADSCLVSDFKSSEEVELYCRNSIGNFPSPRELANLDEKFLEKRCNLGYRAYRILNLARSIVEGRIQLRQLEEACIEPSLPNYSTVKDQLKEIYGFGPFTCSNILVCMGFYHVIPADSETIRHLKQVHAINSTIQTIQRDVETLYGKYAPFQFLAYWSEVWNFYEEWFGKLSEMPCSDYKLITAANMRPRGVKIKRTKTSQ
ncbi:hypothetical protein CEY00_Acc10937 [Actinidia chinensis var. chinensis]|uniref:HhH-GPD domain-containing protein n=1 Tax=Actinidia chinensis var. chinensis TaxID=1590841 RepID=A0A2R6R174_ACTCC|nr:hypothetical protein CEY00_Acc10937 [Actinidia chinensis var. chinensis]